MKLFKKILIISLFLISYSQAQSIAGSYNLTGFSAAYYDISRIDFHILITDSYGIGIQKEGDHYNEGELINKRYQEPVPEFILLTQGIILSVSFNADGSAFINESTYPTTITNPNCVQLDSVQPITDSFTYSAEISENYHIPYNDIFGNESLSPYRGLPAGHFSLNGSCKYAANPYASIGISVIFLFYLLYYII